jgi:hypothetical protein
MEDLARVGLSTLRIEQLVDEAHRALAQQPPNLKSAEV